MPLFPQHPKIEKTLNDLKLHAGNETLENAKKGNKKITIKNTVVENLKLKRKLEVKKQ